MKSARLSKGKFREPVFNGTAHATFKMKLDPYLRGRCREIQVRQGGALSPVLEGQPPSLNLLLKALVCPKQVDGLGFNEKKPFLINALPLFSKKVLF